MNPGSTLVPESRPIPQTNLQLVRMFSRVDPSNNDGSCATKDMDFRYSLMVVFLRPVPL